MKTTYFNTRSAARAFAKANGLTVKDAAINDIPHTASQKDGDGRWYVEQPDDEPSPALTLQEVFDKVATHLLRQDAKSVKNNVCMYRGPDNTMCAAGCLIKDEFYSPSLECKTTANNNVWSALILSGVPATTEARKLINLLQILHDQKEPYAWNGGLISITSAYSLDNYSV